MEIAVYDKDEHFQYLSEWMRARDRKVMPDDMPKAGFIAFDDETPVAVGFIRLVEGGYGQLDGLCTNPAAPGALRDRAIDLVVKNLLEWSREMNLKGLMAYSTDENTIVRSRKHGFVQHPYTVISLSFTSRSA